MTEVARGLDELEAELEALLAPKARGKRDFSVYAGRPNDFIAEVLGVTLWSKQREIVETLELERRVSVPGAVNVGKDYLAGAWAMYCAYAREQLVLLTAATLRQVATILMRDVARFKTNAGLPGEQQKLSLMAPGAGGIMGLTSTEGSKLSGQHGPRGTIIVVSEAQAEQFDDEELMAGLLSNASGEGSRVLAVGNPIRPTGWFARTARQGSGWTVLPISVYDHPNVVERREVIHGAVMAQYIEDTALAFGEDSPVYISRVLGRFPESAVENPLHTRASLLKAYAVPELPGETTLGVDVGGGATDPTVVCIYRGNRAIAFEPIRCEVTDVADRVAALAPRYGVSPTQDGAAGVGRIVIDANGVGAGPAGDLKKKGFKVVAFMSQEAPPKGKKGALLCVNRRTAANWRVRELVRSGDLSLVEDRELEEELLALTYLETDTGKVALEDKKVIRKRLGRSPNKADALAYATWKDPVSISGLSFEVAL